MRKISYIKSESGATSIEYALIATGISLAIVTAVYAFGDEMVLLYAGLEDVLTN